MDERSELGPTDPQMVMSRDGQIIMAPAQAIKDEFEKAQREVNSDPSKLPSWVPILREYGPALLAQCDNQINLSHSLVSQWLARYMFAGDSEGATKAENISKYLSGHNNFHSHARRVGMTELSALGVNVLNMRKDPQLHDAIRDLYTAIMLTFTGTDAFKIFENDIHDSFIQSAKVEVKMAPEAMQQPTNPAPQVPAARTPKRPTAQPPALPRNRVEERLNSKKRKARR
jgi:hypothetical protein